MLRIPMTLFVATLATVAPAYAADEADAPEKTPLELTREEAKALVPQAETDLGRDFLKAAEALEPLPAKRIIYYRRSPRSALRKAQYEALPESTRTDYKEVEVDEGYYYRLYSPPVAYLRALDIASQAGLESVDGKRIADFGFGNMGQLRMLAALGADVVGIEIDGFIDAWLGSEDEGPVARASFAGEGDDGSVSLAFGQFPATEDMIEKVGTGLSLFMSKNTLKLGYVHPEHEADPGQLVHLGVDDETYLRRVHDALAPGGLFVVYNLYGQQAPEGEPYRPWATGGFPFGRALTEKVGFEVVQWNADDSDAARAMGRTLGWNKDQTDEEFAKNFNAMVTVLRKRGD